MWQRWRAQSRRKEAEALLEKTSLPRTETVVVFSQDDADSEPCPERQDAQALMHLVADAQHLNATMTLVKMLIATHHDIHWLKRTWALNVTEQTDALFDAPPPFGDDALKQVMLDAWKLSIQDYTRVINETVRAHGQDDEA